MVGWHHRLDGQESEQAPGVGGGQGGLVCCSPWGRKESDTTEQPNSLIFSAVFLVFPVYTSLTSFVRFIFHIIFWRVLEMILFKISISDYLLLVNRSVLEFFILA